MFSFVVEFVDILFDILYFKEVTGSQFQVYFHSDQRVYKFMEAFLFLGLLKYFHTLRITEKDLNNWTSFETATFQNRSVNMFLTFLLEE